MKKVSWNRIIKDKTVRLLISVFLITVGVWLALPERGLAAVFPLLFLFSFAARFFYFRSLSLSAIASLLAFCYSASVGFSSPVLFAVVSFFSALCGSLLNVSFQKIKEGKKVLVSVFFFLLIAFGILIPIFYAGTPAAYWQEKKRVLEYLESTYPDQEFSEVGFYFDPAADGYRVKVEYEYLGNTLESSLFFGEEIEDGFFEDFSLHLQEERKSELIEILSEGEEKILIDSVVLKKSEENRVVFGSIEAPSKKIETQFSFSATYREEKPERREFAAAIRKTHALLSEKAFLYDKITFYAIDAGKIVYQCTVTPETDPEEILSLVTFAK